MAYILISRDAVASKTDYIKQCFNAKRLRIFNFMFSHIAASFKNLSFVPIY